ncbi:hypothetical protein ITP53_12250 [Nonomuraea sp. K274]|uniref:Uncharacterized protein n=1 Tax=Nonomuraea cypriaca TaxID=1187855 RepID=A0A931A9H6_9ACTN|nr:hypothetical protein [Nonomuraea cypriaca]MBF8186498.1 hypothetical protein [Nonomuraea cypriaca]
MFKSGLILAGVVGGLLLSGGSALASTTKWPADEGDDSRKIILVCGDENIIAHEAEANKTGLIFLDTGDILSGILGKGSGDDVKCTLS